MKARINTYAFRQTRIESARLGVLGTVAHPIADEGEYVGTVRKGKRQVATFHLTVDSEVKQAQANVDLANLTPKGRHSKRLRPASFSMTSKGYLVLYVSEGAGGVYVVLDKLGAEKRNEDTRRRAFDSRRLGREDVFIVSLLRPGRYEMTDQTSRSEGHVTVAYPKPQRQPYVPPEPEKVAVSEKGFRPAELELRAAQSIVFTIGAEEASLRVQLVEPDDGPGGKGERRGKTRWTNPLRPER